MRKVNGLVLAARKSKLAGPYFEVIVGLQAAVRSVVLSPEMPDVGSSYDDEHVVSWVKPDENETGLFVVGLRNTRVKRVSKRTVFTTEFPKIGEWIPVNLT